MSEHTIPAETTSATKPVRPWKVIAAASIGNALEWYDISIYAYFSVYISVAFFPSESHSVSIMLALGTFALSFFIRPVGAIVLGSYADRKGRKPALTLTIWLMFFGTLLIVIMPPAHVIGLAAPLLILLARLIQGFAAGGEFGSATSLMVEHLPNRKGFAASWQFTSQAMSTVLASVIGVSLTTSLSQEQLETWGFRLPFIVGLLVGPVGLYIRRHVPESPEFTAAAAEVPEKSAAIGGILRHHKLAVVLAIGAIAVSTCLNYFITYVPTYAMDNLGMTSSAGFWATLVSGIVLLLATPHCRLLQRQDRAADDHDPGSRGCDGADVGALHLGRRRKCTDRAHCGDRHLLSAQGCLLRSAGQRDGRYLPDRGPRYRTLTGLQRRSSCLRRADTTRCRVADRRHRRCQGTCLLGVACRCAQCGCDPRGVEEARRTLIPTGLGNAVRRKTGCTSRPLCALACLDVHPVFRRRLPAAAVSAGGASGPQSA
nr:MFS transporter [Brevibacterium aurantiacum]